jgi:hypothetical protein
MTKQKIKDKKVAKYFAIAIVNDEGKNVIFV